MDLQLPPDFREFLGLLASARIEYLLVGGYAVAFHGYPRPTGDLDVWVAIHPDTAARMVAMLREFGFAGPEVKADLFMQPGRVVRMGMPPVRIEVLTSISGVEFASCHARRVTAIVEGVEVSFISAADLLVNKQAAGREKDMNDVKHLQQGRSGA